MKKYAFVSAVAGMLLMAACAPAAQEAPGQAEQPQGREMNILMWEAYIPQDIIDEFTEQTGIQVNQSFFLTNEDMFSMLQVQRGVYDVTFASDYMVQTMIQHGGLLQQLNKDNIPNIVNIDPLFRGSYYDPDDLYSVPYAAAYALLVYDTERVPFEINSYADLWSDGLENSIVLLESARDVIGMVLKSLGESFNETDDEVLDVAEARLMELWPNVFGFTGALPSDVMINGDATVGYMFGAQVADVLDAIPTARYVFPQEGMALYVDNLLIVEDAPNLSEAEEFLNFVLDAQVSARITETIRFMGTNQAAHAYISPETLNNRLIFLPEEELANLEQVMPIGAANVRFDEIWTRFRS